MEDGLRWAKGGTPDRRLQKSSRWEVIGARVMVVGQEGGHRKY